METDERSLQERTFLSRLASALYLLDARPQLADDVWAAVVDRQLADSHWWRSRLPELDDQAVYQLVNLSADVYHAHWEPPDELTIRCDPQDEVRNPFIVATIAARDINLKIERWLYDQLKYFSYRGDYRDCQLVVKRDDAQQSMTLYREGRRLSALTLQWATIDYQQEPTDE